MHARRVAALARHRFRRRDGGRDRPPVAGDADSRRPPGGCGAGCRRGVRLQSAGVRQVCSSATQGVTGASRRFGDPVPEARRRDAGGDARARRHRCRRPRHRERPRLPRLAVLLRPGDPAARRLQGVGGVDPSPRRGRDRAAGSRGRGARRSRSPRSAQPVGAVDRSGGAGRLPGLARRGDRSARELGSVGDRAPRHRPRRRRAAHVPVRARRLPGAPGGEGSKPALHAARRVHGRGRLRAPPLRQQRHVGRCRPCLPRLAAHGWRDRPAVRPDAAGHPAARRHQRPSPVRRGDRWRPAPGDLARRLARAAIQPGPVRPGHDRRHPVPGPGRGRRLPDLDAARSLDPDAPRGTGGLHLGGCGGRRLRELLRGAGQGLRHRARPGFRVPGGRSAGRSPLGRLARDERPVARRDEPARRQPRARSPRTGSRSLGRTSWPERRSTTRRDEAGNHRPAPRGARSRPRCARTWRSRSRGSSSSC